MPSNNKHSGPIRVIEKYDDELTPEELMRKYPNLTRKEAEKISDGWWQDPAGGWHSPDETDFASQYESVKEMLESEKSPEEITESILTEKETGLLVYADSAKDHEKLRRLVSNQSFPFYGEEDSTESYFFFEEEPSGYDQLERDLEKEFRKNSIDVRYESV